VSASTWKHTLLSVPGIGVSLLPKLVCPMCWPAYAGVVSALGLGFLIGTTYLPFVTGVFLATSTGVLGFRAHQRRGYGPFGTGLMAAIVVLVGKFQLESGVTTYAGIGLLVAASAWNVWPRRVTEAHSCPSCVGQKTNALNT
jgi:hypothetical protein